MIRARRKQSPRAAAARLSDAELGIAWWNGLTRLQRAVWLERSGSAVPADAWQAFKGLTARGAP